ncbi:MFS transporter [Methylocystis iwaonis]|uniref:MFS transporter n=1 Tax=Methylocystis iwaonis TaxID=2885079 RepID=A0ABN6VLR0_9HYPH|nr:MFS transporter [Methylocystis iwaonis]BDV36022.1 MFS transporter [Methylocystis iwaonis]
MSASLLSSRHASLLLVQFLTAATPLAVIPFLSLQLEQLTGGRTAEASFWTAVAAAAPAATAVVATPLWSRFARGREVSLLLSSTCVLTAASYVTMAIADGAATFAIGRALQGAAGSSIILLLAIDGSSARPTRGYIDLQQAFSAGCCVGPILGGWAFAHQRLSVLLFFAAAALVALATACALLFRSAYFYPPQRREGETQLSESVFALGGRNRVLIVAALFGTAGAFGFIPFFAEWAMRRDAARLDSSAAGMVHASAWLAAMIVLPIWSRVIESVAATRSIAFSLLGTSAACAALSLSATTPWIIAFRIAHGAFHSGLNPAVYAGVRQSDEGVGELAWARTAVTLGQILGPALCGAVVPFAGVDGALALAAGLPAVGLLVLLSVRGDR